MKMKWVGFFSGAFLMLGCNSEIRSVATEQLSETKKEYQSRWALNAPGLHDILLELDADYSKEPSTEKEAELQIREWGVAVAAGCAQPELADALISGITTPTIESAYLRAAYYANLSSSILGISVQPEQESWVNDHLISVPASAENGESMIEQIARVHALLSLIDGVAKQPESKDTLKAFFEAHLPSLRYSSEPMMKISRAYAVGYALNSIAIQPELADELQGLIVTYLGAKIALTDAQMLLIKPYLKESYIKAVVKQPEMACTFIQIVQDMTDVLVDSTTVCP